MAWFRYSARDAQGNLQRGHLEAHSVEAVADRLLGDGFSPLTIEPDARAGEQRDGSAQGSRFERAVALTDLMVFSRQMYSLVRAGVPIMRAMTGLAETARHPRMARVIRAVASELENGRALAEALRQHPDVFDGLFVSIIQVGENSGRLDEAFLQLSRHLEREKATRDQIRAAMRYPVIVLVAIAIAIGVINVFVIPAFGRMFTSFGAELPLATRVLLATSDFTVQYWYVVLGGVTVLAAGFIWWKRTPGGRYRWDRTKLRIPVIGDIVLRATLARFGRSFAMATRSGVPIITALSMVARAADNAWIGERIERIRTGIERGEGLTRSAANTELFPALVMQMIAVGEETGQVDDMLEEVADFYDREVEYDIKQLNAYIEPLMLVVVGILVLILALGVFLPMWDLGQAAL